MNKPKTQAQLERRKRQRERYKANRKTNLGQLDPAIRPVIRYALDAPVLGRQHPPSTEKLESVYDELAAKISLDSDKPSEPATSAPDNNQILAAIQGLAGLIQEVDQNTRLAFAEVNNRIATVEEAQSQGLLTLGSESAIYGVDSSFGTNIPGAIPQSQLVKSRQFQDIKVDEARILSEPGLDLPDPTDARIVIVGTTTEAEKLRRQALLHGGNQGGY